MFQRVSVVPLNVFGLIPATGSLLLVTDLAFEFSQTPQFLSISCCLLIPSLFFLVHPLYRMRIWARREAERKVKEREALGLPVLDSNYYDPSKIVLPPEDEI
ncbi:hypothetical protein JD844_010600 [Phrynosoma platyrhinos]|uniref:NADH dehydrogenase [ubiquinone] 1 beta subcomplex subunit 11, mitochondrial n=1 Tax=Phrynosoma platyrhinos TaxID=52577 RepID=A0ABQ7THK6_PHRPL|nr:hypothetical protein JD844_010600 [Phrynosoma platyrhinos]